MTRPARRTLGDSSLIDLLDRLVETGVVASGDVLLGLADVDLIRVNLRLVLGAVDTLMADDDDLPTVSRQPQPPREQPRQATAGPSRGSATAEPSLGSVVTTPRNPPATAPVEVMAPAGRALSLDSSDRSDLGVGGLLVAVIEIVHRLLERQAIHRMERGSLTSEQIERLGQALMALDQRVNQLIEIFNPHSAPALPVTVAGAAH